jgi:uncharacterized protein (DUF2062 family)
VVFKRREPRNMRQRLRDIVYPKGGWWRAGSYVLHRVRRLPDPPHRIARGVACGVFVSFTPFYGFHFVLAGLGAWAIRANIPAALMATFVGNPLTLPFIATVSVAFGARMLGMPHGMPLPRIVGAFGQATLELWRNLYALFTVEPMHWDRFVGLFVHVFLPYLIGGILPGLVCAIASYMATHRIIAAYPRRRLRKRKDRVQTRRQAAEAAAGAAAGAAAAAKREETT